MDPNQDQDPNLPPTPRDPLAEGLSLGSAEIKRFIQVTISLVNYGQFIGLTPPLPVDQFERLRAIAMIDEFFSVSDPEIKTRLLVTDAFLTQTRANPHYLTMRESIRAAAKIVSGVNGDMTQFSESVQGVVAQEFLTLGLTAVGERERLVALGQLADRASPKRSRKELPAPVVSFPDNVLRTIQMALEAGMKFGAEGAAVKIDAAKLNVPPLLPAVIDVTPEPDSDSD